MIICLASSFHCSDPALIINTAALAVSINEHPHFQGGYLLSLPVACPRPPSPARATPRPHHITTPGTAPPRPASPSANKHSTAPVAYRRECYRYRCAQRAHPLRLPHCVDFAAVTLRYTSNSTADNALSLSLARPTSSRPPKPVFSQSGRAHRSRLTLSRPNHSPSSSEPSSLSPLPMKYLEIPELETLCRALSFTSPECRVSTRIEAYSCKPVKQEKRLYKSLEKAYAEELAFSPPGSSAFSTSPFGPLDVPAARKTLYLLISTLNAAFPDHDFSDVRPEEFTKEPNAALVLNGLGLTLLSLRGGATAPRSWGAYPALGSSADSSVSVEGMEAVDALHAHAGATTAGGITHPALQSVLDSVINVAECDVYSYSPDEASDPHAAADDDDASVSDSIFSTDDEDASPPHRSSALPRRRRSRMDDDDDGPFAYGFDDFMDVGPPTPSHTAVPRRMFDAAAAAAAREPSPAPSVRSTRSAAPSAYGDGSSGLLWSSHYFFYNRKMKRILFMTVWSRKTGVYPSGPSHLPISDKNPFWLSASLPPPVKLENEDVKPFASLSKGKAGGGGSKASRVSKRAASASGGQAGKRRRKGV